MTLGPNKYQLAKNIRQALVSSEERDAQSGAKAQESIDSCKCETKPLLIFVLSAFSLAGPVWWDPRQRRLA